MERTSLRAIFSGQWPLSRILVKGWVRSVRRGKKLSFIMLYDGSCFEDLQIIADGHLNLEGVGVGAALAVQGDLVESQGKGQGLEVQAHSLTVVGAVDEDYPLQKKGHSLEFLREKAHLRPRTRTLSAVFRVRHALSMATHQFFHQREFYYVHSPIITGLDCEGAGEMFRVSTDHDYFGIPTYLTVSGQLSAECFAQGMGACYTFGPTFRSENSNTPRHLAEFWMIEPEVAFCDLSGLTQLASDYWNWLVQFTLQECERELAFLHRQYAPNLPRQLPARKFTQISYAEAIQILQGSRREFSYPVAYGKDLQTEHERFLTEEHFKQPVIVVDYPKEIKAFYMKQNDDGKTVRAMDFLVPGVGELMGGGQREEDPARLRQRIRELGMGEKDYQWYLELRRFGTTPHSGFGLGLERAVMSLTGMTNIRDVIPFPRTPRNARF